MRKNIILLAILTCLLTASDYSQQSIELLEEMEDKNIEKYYFIGGLDLFKYNDVVFQFEYQDGKEKLTQELSIYEIVGFSKAFRLEFTFSKSSKDPNQLDVQFYPRDLTFVIIERWQEVHKMNQDIPFPKEAINKQNWYEASDSLNDIAIEFSVDLQDYILTGNLGATRTMENIVKKDE